MTTAHVHSRAQLGLSAPAVNVEVHLPSGLPNFSTTGINGNELRDRVKSAIQNSSFEFPAGRIVVNLGPAELPKAGGRYDLAVAAGILVASEQLPAACLNNLDLIGELSLFGDVRAVRGGLTAARESTAAGRTLVCPAANSQEFTGAAELSVRLIRHLDDLPGLTALPTPKADEPTTPDRAADPLAPVIGQERAKRALTIAAAGGHHMLMTGPPGAGKTMLAERLRDLLPPLVPNAAREVAEIYSLSGLSAPGGAEAPFRAPHHGASCAALTGGGSPPVPGEITHAHNGVLFLDEMPEFRRDALEALREPLESGTIRISRRGYAIQYPARFQLVAAMNPCPAGLVCKPLTCRCAPNQAERYRNRISMPVLDRIDLHIAVAAVPVAQLLPQEPAGTGEPLTRSDSPHSEPADYLQAIEQSRALQFARSGCLNAHLSQQQTEALCGCDEGVSEWLREAAEKLELSARGYYRALRVARTIQDIDTVSEPGPDAGSVSRSAIAEALSYRALAAR